MQFSFRTLLLVSQLTNSLATNLVPFLQLSKRAAVNGEKPKNVDHSFDEPADEAQDQVATVNVVYKAVQTIVPGPPEETPRPSPENPTVHDLCISDAFQPTPENYINADVTPFLTNHTLTQAQAPQYQAHGLLHSLTATHLGTPCTPPHCPHTCRDITERVLTRGGTPADAQRLFFVLTSAANVDNIFASVLTSLTTAQSNVGLWAPRMAQLFFWTEPTHYEKTYAALMSFFSAFVQTALASASVFLDFAALAAGSRVLEAGIGESLTRAEWAGSGAAELVRLRRELERQQARTLRLEALALLKGSRWWNGAIMPWGAGLAVDQTFGQVGRFVAWEGRERGGNAEMLQMAVQQIASEARRNVRNGVTSLWKGAEYDTHGNTPLSKLLEAGAFITPNPAATRFWASPSTEENLTRALSLRTLSIAYQSQPMWITCTTQYLAPDPRRNSYSTPLSPVPSCALDRSGDQHLKACVDHLACYLNRWNARGGAHAHQLERPYGWDQLPVAPWNTSAAAIITSSVRSYLARTGTAADPTDVLTSPTNLTALSAKLWDDAAPGTFQLPVCVSDHNWNGPVEPVFSLTCDANPFCRKKALPCSCGPWGSETRAVWEEAGLWAMKHAKEEYRKHLCPRRINERVTDPLERWVALCRLDVRRLRGGWKRDGAAPMCPLVLKELELSGAAKMADVDPGLKTELGCLAGAVDDRGCLLMGYGKEVRERKMKGGEAGGKDAVLGAKGKMVLVEPERERKRKGVKFDGTL